MKVGDGSEPSAKIVNSPEEIYRGFRMSLLYKSKLIDSYKRVSYNLKR